MHGIFIAYVSCIFPAAGTHCVLCAAEKIQELCASLVLPHLLRVGRTQIHIRNAAHGLGKLLIGTYDFALKKLSGTQVLDARRSDPRTRVPVLF